MNEHLLQIAATTSNPALGAVAARYLNTHNLIRLNCCHLIGVSAFKEWLMTKPSTKSIEFVAARLRDPDVLALCPTRSEVVVKALLGNPNLPASALRKLAGRAVKSANKALAASVARHPNCPQATRLQLAESVGATATSVWAYARWIEVRSTVETREELAAWFDAVRADDDHPMRRYVYELGEVLAGIYAVQGPDVARAAIITLARDDHSRFLVPCVAAVDHVDADITERVSAATLVAAARLRVAQRGRTAPQASQWTLCEQAVRKAVAVGSLDAQLWEASGGGNNDVDLWLSAIGETDRSDPALWKALLDVPGRRDDVFAALKRHQSMHLSLLHQLSDSERAELCAVYLTRMAENREPAGIVARLLAECENMDDALAQLTWTDTRLGETLANLDGRYILNPQKIAALGCDPAEVIHTYLARVKTLTTEQFHVLRDTAGVLETIRAAMAPHLVTWMCEQLPEACYETFLSMADSWGGSINELTETCRAIS